jgi:hypothetical protein
MNFFLFISLINYHFFIKKIGLFNNENYIHNIINSNKSNIFYEIVYEKDKYLNKNNNITLFIEENKYNKYNKYNINDLIILLFNAII